MPTLVVPSSTTRVMSLMQVTVGGVVSSASQKAKGDILSDILHITHVLLFLVNSCRIDSKTTKVSASFAQNESLCYWLPETTHKMLH